MLLLYVKMAVLYENVIDLIIFETLKVLFGNILLKKYYSTMICGLDKKNDLKGDYDWFRLAILPCDQLSKENTIKKILSVGELNPGLPRDSRGYLPLY